MVQGRNGKQNTGWSRNNRQQCNLSKGNQLGGSKFYNNHSRPRTTRKVGIIPGVYSPSLYLLQGIF